MPMTARIVSSRSRCALSKVVATAGSDAAASLCGQLGANPHVHTRTSELFFVLDGSIDVLAGDDVATASAGDLVVVPPGQPHAFAASAGKCADVLVMITPGTERFEFFRALARAMAPGADPAERLSVLRGQNDYDTHSTESATWSTR